MGKVSFFLWLLLLSFTIICIGSCFRQVESAKKNYHGACKEEKLASMRETNGKADPAVDLKKLSEKVEKCKQDSQKVSALARRSHPPRRPSWFSMH